MAIRKITDLTTAARKGLTDFLEDEEGGTGKNAALSTGMLVGGILLMQALAVQTAEGVKTKCAYAQECPTSDFCFPSTSQTVGCGNPQGGCNAVDFCDDG